VILTGIWGATLTGLRPACPGLATYAGQRKAPSHIGFLTIGQVGHLFFQKVSKKWIVLKVFTLPRPTWPGWSNLLPWVSEKLSRRYQMPLPNVNRVKNYAGTHKHEKHYGKPALPRSLRPATSRTKELLVLQAKYENHRNIWPKSAFRRELTTSAQIA